LSALVETVGFPEKATCDSH